MDELRKLFDEHPDLSLNLSKLHELWVARIVTRSGQGLGLGSNADMNFALEVASLQARGNYARFHSIQK